MRTNLHLRDTLLELEKYRTRALRTLLVAAVLASSTTLAAAHSSRGSDDPGAEVSALFVVQDGVRVALSWRAGSRADIVGFNLWREENGVRARVNAALIAGAALATAEGFEAPSFHVEDTLSAPTSYVQYWLESIDSAGTSSWEGPVARSFGSLSGEAPERQPFEALESVSTTSLPGLGTTGGTIVSATGMGAVRPTTVPARATHGQRAQQSALAADPGLKIFVTNEGWYRISRSEMTASGYDPGPDAGILEIFTGGISQPIVVNDGGDGRFDPSDTVEFYGLGLDTVSTGARTYWLHTGPNGERLQVPAFKSGSPLAASVPFTVERKERTTFNPFILTTTSTEENFFGPVITPASVSQNLTVLNHDPNFAGTATLEITLMGVRINMQEPVGVELNGHVAGTVVAYANTGIQTLRLDVPQAWLAAGTNVVTLTDRNPAYGHTLLVSTRLTYQHLLRADDGLLEVALPPNSQATVAGFPTGAIRAIDVSDPTAPAALGVSVTTDGASFAATFTTPRSKTGSTVLVLADTRTLGAPEMSPNSPSSWSTSGSSLRADLVIVSNAAFAAAADSLKSVRDAGGIATVIADVEDLYDEFSFGVRTPQAIRDFLQRSTRWKKAPRYVLLVGDASSDPRNYLGTGAFDLVPTRLVTTGYLKTSSDAWFTDFDEDGVEDLPIGRLPVRTAAEAAAVIQKIATRGNPTGSWAGRSLLVSDAWGTSNFPQTSEALRPLFPAAITTQSMTFGKVSKETLVGALNSGNLLVNYFGHADLEYWGTNVFNSADATNLTNGAQLPVMMLIACYNGYFHRPNSRSLAEALLQAPNGGAVAVWASSAVTSASGEAVLNQEFYKQLFGIGSPTIGEAMKAAKLAITDHDIRRSYILFGDPSMKLR